MPFMKKLWFILPALLLAVTAAAENRVSRTSGAPDTVTLDNGLIKLSFAPELNGSLIKWEYPAQKRSLIGPLNYRVEKVDLLPTRVFASRNGFRCRVWESNRKITDAMQVISLTATPDDGCKLTMSAPITGGMELALTQNLHLRQESTVLDGEIVLVNSQKFSGNYSLWFNAVLSLSDKIDPVLVPARSNVSRIGKLGMIEVKADGILSELHEGNRNMFFAALRPWIAKAAVNTPGTAVLKIDEPDTGKMVLYTHKSANLHTMEILAPAKKLDAKESFRRKFQLFFFPSLTSVREICGSFGVDIRNGCLEIESAIPAAPSIWNICGKDHPVPELKPGKLYKIKLASAPGANFRIKINGREFVLPGRLSYDMKKVY